MSVGSHTRGKRKESHLLAFRLHPICSSHSLLPKVESGVQITLDPLCPTQTPTLACHSATYISARQRRPLGQPTTLVTTYSILQRPQGMPWFHSMPSTSRLWATHLCQRGQGMGWDGMGWDRGCQAAHAAYSVQRTGTVAGQAARLRTLHAQKHVLHVSFLFVILTTKKKS